MAQRAKHGETTIERAWQDLAERAGPSVQALLHQGGAVLERMLGHEGEGAHPHGAAPIELCRRVAELPLADTFGVQHWWLRGDGFEAGMGQRGGGVPGHKGQYRYQPFTTINDHTGEGNRPDASCQPIGQVDPRWRHVDPACVREQMTVGRDTGIWTPPLNDCHEVVRAAMYKCRVSDEEAAADTVPVRAAGGRR